MHLGFCVSVDCLRELRGLCFRGHKSDPVNRYLPTSNFQFPTSKESGCFGSWELEVGQSLVPRERTIAHPAGHCSGQPLNRFKNSRCLGASVCRIPCEGFSSGAKIPAPHDEDAEG